ncbi:MAG: IS1634 family transposase [Rhodothermaceae bacterium]|nr:IS1634 family transposase [Rhodothermaceae bacterium]MYC05456.1 IS1634 family transposase [Rhodothermaceae bacterium]MYI17295.1 IS1634 family transposase [Rhodothermaceae bacterium]
MFVRTLRRSTTKNVAVKIVENYRNKKGQHRQRIIRHMGSVPEGKPLEALVQLAHLEMVRIQEQIKPTLFPAESYVEEVVAARLTPKDTGPLPIADARKLEEERRICLGFHEALGTLYDTLGVSKVFDARHQMSRRLFKQAVLLRLATPGDSKLAHSRQISKEAGVEVSVDKFYRMMDAVTDERIEELKRRVSDETVGMLGGKLQVLFFDVTTLSFASEQADTLRKKGFSKDGKPHKVQVVLALIQTQEGLPVTYELFPGNTADVSTLEPAMLRLREQFDLDQMIVVADAGMLSQENLSLLQSLGCDYVVAARLRSLNQVHTQAIVGEQSWTMLSTGRKVTEHTLGGRRLILRYCPKKAARDVHKRDQAVEKVKKRLAQGVKGVGRSGRFLKVDPQGVRLDEAAIARDQNYDGLHGVWTSLTDLSPEQVYHHYGELWRIEEGFRVMKHTMAVRPMFHWVERRVRAHVAICFVAFALLRILRHRYNTLFGAKQRLSEGQILAELSQVQASLICDRGTDAEYLLPSKARDEAIRLYHAVGQKLPRQTVLFKPGSTA